MSAISNLEIEMGKAVEEFTLKLRRLADAHIAASHVELSTRERSLDDRERQLHERERALNDRAKVLERHGIAQREAPKDAMVDALKDKALEQSLLGDGEQAMLKSNQPERAKAALMVPSPTRARSGSIPTQPQRMSVPPASAVNKLTALRLAPQQTVFSPRQKAAAPPVPPCSPPVGSSPPVATMVGLAKESPQSDDASVPRVSVIERKEKLLAALTSGCFQANSTFVDESSIMNSSMVSTPGRQTTGRGSGITGRVSGVAGGTRRSLAELLEADQARMNDQVRQ